MGQFPIHTYTSSLQKMDSIATVDNFRIVQMGWWDNFRRGIGHIVHQIISVTVVSYSILIFYGQSPW